MEIRFELYCKPLLNILYQKALDTELDGHRVLAFQSEKHFEDFRKGKIVAPRVPPLELIGKPYKSLCPAEESPTTTPTQKKTCGTPTQVSSGVDSSGTRKHVGQLTESEDEQKPLLEPGNNFIESDYHPDTESGDSRLSDSTEYFR